MLSCMRASGELVARAADDARRCARPCTRVDGVSSGGTMNGSGARAAQSSAAFWKVTDMISTSKSMAGQP